MYDTALLIAHHHNSKCANIGFIWCIGSRYRWYRWYRWYALQWLYRWCRPWSVGCVQVFPSRLVLRRLSLALRPWMAGHEYWKRKFPGMIRVLHRLDLARNTRVMEERLDGNGPWYFVKQGMESKEAGYITGATGTHRPSRSVMAVNKNNHHLSWLNQIVVFNQ